MRACVAVLLATISAPTHAADGVERLAWLSNCWAAEGGEAGSGEQWTTADGGALFGIARTVQGGGLASFEFLRIVERGGGLVFIAQPGGRAPVEFPATEIGDTHVVFENLANDFPQRVIYRLVEPGVLRARIEGAINDPDAAMDFPLRRIDCP